MLKIQKITRQFTQDKETRGVKNVSFSVARGEVVCVLGASGSGKSTLLRVVAGLEKTDTGNVLIEEDNLIGYVPQEYTLWPHLTVLENLTLAPTLKNKKLGRSITNEAKILLDRFGLSEYMDSFPGDLSGGQRQRVALLRAIMVKPQVLLLDEITSALDPELTKGVLDLIRALAKDGYTMVIVTHHMSFAMSVADRILFLKNGLLVQDQKAIEFFSSQKDPEIQSFILDIAKKDDSIQVFKGREQFQAYHIGMMKRLPEKSTYYVAGGVGDAWYGPMEDFYDYYQKIRIKKQIVCKMITYVQDQTDRTLQRKHPKLNRYRKMPRNIQNPANYNVFLDTVITQIFEDEPTIIEIRNQKVADGYMRFFEEMWEASK